MTVSINGIDKQGVALNGVQVLQTLSTANDTVSKGVYAATTLSAVDTDLAVGNIKSGVTIFGKAGTFAGGPIVDDIEAAQVTALTATQAGTYFVHYYLLADAEEYEVATKTQSYSANSRAVAVGFMHGSQQFAGNMTAKLYMDGVQMAESGQLVAAGSGSSPHMLTGIKALSGSKICKIIVKNTRAGTNFVYIASGPISGSVAAAGVAIGSVKL